MLIISLISGYFFVALRKQNNKEMNQYPTNLADNQWQVIENFLDEQVRKCKYSL
jgi:hypothetical protein